VVKRDAHQQRGEKPLELLFTELYGSPGRELCYQPLLPKETTYNPL
jgi:hypothetical protein